MNRRIGSTTAKLSSDCDHSSTSSHELAEKVSVAAMRSRRAIISSWVTSRLTYAAPTLRGMPVYPAFQHGGSGLGSIRNRSDEQTAPVFPTSPDGVFGIRQRPGCRRARVTGLAGPRCATRGRPGRGVFRGSAAGPAVAGGRTRFLTCAARRGGSYGAGSEALLTPQWHRSPRVVENPLTHVRGSAGWISARMKRNQAK